MINDGRQDSVDIIKEKADELLEAMNVSNQKKAQEILNEIKEQVDNLEGIIAVFV
jgi:enoyl-[acyl-carrier-protein] reductase (NADH)